MVTELNKEVPLLEVENLKKYFPINKGLLSKKVGEVKAVDGVSFTLNKKETLGIVGESGCGKSTTARLIIKLLDPTNGSIKLDGVELADFNAKEMRMLRKDIQMIFQDPFSSLNPRWTVERTLSEPLKVFGIGDAKSRKERVYQLLNQVGLDESYAKRYAHEFSGGQRQRIGIARALALNPKLIIADEPVSALDISVQSQVINLMQDLQEEFDLAYLFITHDLSVVNHIADRVIVMYLGKIVEIADTEELFSRPLHPYTEALISAVPDVEAENKQERIVLQGDVPTPSNPPRGCPFHTRCPKAMDACKLEVPNLKEVTDGHFTACHLYEN